MDPHRNPFSPGAGSPPPELAGRDELLTQARTTLVRTKAGKFEQSLMLVGLRGVGKTVLLNRVRDLRQILFRLDTLANVSNKVKRALRVLTKTR